MWEDGKGGGWWNKMMEEGRGKDGRERGRTKRGFCGGWGRGRMMGEMLERGRD